MPSGLMEAMTDVIRVDPVTPDPTALLRAAECLRRGGLVAFPTETVYGLGVHALDRAAVRRLFEAKGRPANDPLIVHVDAVESMQALVANVPDAARQLAARFWPGPLTIVLPRSSRVPDEVTGLAGASLLPARSADSVRRERRSYSPRARRLHVDGGRTAARHHGGGRRPRCTG